MNKGIIEKINWVLRTFILITIVVLFVTDQVASAVFLLITLIFGFLLFRFWKREGNYFLDLIYLIMIVLHVFGLMGMYDILFYDDIMHFYAGFFLGAFFYDVFGKGRKWKVIFVLPLLIVFGIGLGWELFEFTWDNLVSFRFGYVPVQRGMWDTILDVVLDLVGALVGILFFSRRR